MLAQCSYCCSRYFRSEACQSKQRAWMKLSVFPGSSPTYIVSVQLWTWDYLDKPKHEKSSMMGYYLGDLTPYIRSLPTHANLTSCPLPLNLSLGNSFSRYGSPFSENILMQKERSWQLWLHLMTLSSYRLVPRSSHSSGIDHLQYARAGQREGL